MQKATINVGDRIDMEHVKSHIGKKISTNKYRSQLLYYDGIKSAKIFMPIFEGRVVPLEIGDEYSLCFYTNSGLYQCVACITKRYLQKQFYILNVELITPVKRIQRRKFYRLECLFTAEFRIITEAEKSLIKKLKNNNFINSVEEEECVEELEKLQNEWNEGTVSDVSGGGIRFHSKAEIRPEDQIEVKLPLTMDSGIITIKVMTRVVACIYDKESRFAYEIRGEFINLGDMDREAIIKYVFEEQRRKMKKD